VALCEKNVFSYSAVMPHCIRSWVISGGRINGAKTSTSVQ